MKRAGFLILLASVLASSAPIPAAAEDPFNPHFLLTDDEMTDSFAMSREDVRDFLARGALYSFFDVDVDGRRKNAADIIYENGQRFGINPQFLLVLLQREQSLVEDGNPTRDQLDWAMGYGVCDDCAKDDPGIQKFRGFANQVYYASQRIAQDYLPDLAATGVTPAGIGPGLSTTIDGRTVTPANKATAVLYSYTPHLHGNQNFVAIWNRWFGQKYPNGSLLRDKFNGDVYLIKDGLRHRVASMMAFLSRFNPSMVLDVESEVIAAYQEGVGISYPNYSLLRSPNGTVHLLVDETVRPIVSEQAFREIGFNSEELIDVTDEALAAYSLGPVITEETKFPQGVLKQDPASGGVFFVENDRKRPIMSRELLMARFAGWPVNKSSTDELAGYPTGDAVLFPDGTLIGVAGSPDVFVVSDGLRRPILDEETFHAFGYKFENVVWTNERSVLLHPLGDALTLEPTPDA